MEGQCDFINEQHIEQELAVAKQAGVEKVQELIDKALSLKGLTSAEAAILLQVDNEDVIHQMMQAAGSIKARLFGQRIVLYAPLYLSNECCNNCLYCGFRRDNTLEQRKTLTVAEIAAEARVLVNQGQTIALLVSGEDPAKSNIEYLLEAVKAVYSTGIKRVDMEVAPLPVEDLVRLKAAGVGTVVLFQETYHLQTYQQMHPVGKKAIYKWRLSAMDRIMQAGFRDVGIGALFGLYDYKFEVLALLKHAKHLAQTYGVGPRTICIPRLRPALGSALQSPPQPVSDWDFKKLIAVMKLALPYTGICLSTRELPALREELFNAGIVQLSAGSRTNPGGYTGEERHDEEQFPIEDGRSVEEMSIVIGEQGFLPSFCTDCFSSKRDGAKWMEYAQQEAMPEICNAQAVKSLLRYREKCSPEKLASLDQIIKKYQI